jgi:predicted transcriptional regulator
MVTWRKQDVLDIVGEMPEEVDVDELHYRLYLLQRIREGDAAYGAGDIVPQEEVERQSESWLTELDRRQNG